MIDLFRSKLTKRSILITLIVVFFALSTVYVITVHIMSSSVRGQIESRDNLISKTLSKNVSNTFDTIVSDLRVTSNFLVTDSPTDRTFYWSQLQRIVSNNSFYLFVDSFDANGRLITQVPEMNIFTEADVQNILYRLKWSKTFYISNLITLPNHMKTIAVAYPAIDSNGKYRGGMIAYVNLSMLSDLLQQFKIGTHGMNAVVDRKETIIGDSDSNRIGTSIQSTTLGQNLYMEKYGIWQGDLFDKEMIFGYRPLMAGGFGLFAGEPIEQAMESSNHVMRLLFLGFLVVLAVAVVLTTFGTLQVIRPIDQLIRQVREYRENKRRKFELVKTNDEIEELSFVMGRMAEELTEKERKLFYILESIPYGVITMDKDGRITSFNKGAEELTGFAREETVDKYLIDIPIKENAESFISWKTIQKGKEFDEIETYILDKWNQKHDVRLHSSLFYNDENILLGSILILRDVSDLKKLEEFLRQSERLASLGQLTAGITHEIKNPLSIILGAVEAIGMELKENPINVSLIEQWADDIMESSDRMNQLLTDFLQLSKGENIEIKEKLDLAAIINELLHLLRKKFKDKDIQIKCQYISPHIFVLGNKTSLTQVFLNIFINSLQAMDNGGILTVRIVERNVDWEIQIEDTGKGIPAAKIQWIFNPFFSTKTEGTGLGLSIAFEIISQHNGKISASSEEGVGTIVYILLPKAGDANHESNPSRG